MKRLSRLIVSTLLWFGLTGCGVGFGSLKMSVDKEFPFGDVEKVKAGMKEAQVVEVFGKPAAFGVDEQGRDYLLYLRISHHTRAVVAASPGVQAATGNLSLKGFEVRVYLRDGLVQGVGYTVYQPEEVALK